MKIILQLAFFCIAFSAISVAQSPGIKTITTINPVFPADAKNTIYGESIKITVDLDDNGRVMSARAFGPMMPCSNLNDPVVTRIQEAAIDAAKKSVFESSPAVRSLTLTYRLRPKPIAQDEKGKAVFHGVRNGKAISLPQPSYPAQAKAKHVTGTVKISIYIGEDGGIISAGAISGHPDLVRVSIEAACKARFTPTTVDGQSVKVGAEIAYNFGR